LQRNAFGIFPRSIVGGVHYEICDPDSDRVVGRAIEQVSGSKALAGFLFGRQMMDGTIVVLDERTQQRLLVIERSSVMDGVITAKPSKVKLWNQRDELLARFSLFTKALGGFVLDFDADCTVF